MLVILSSERHKVAKFSVEKLDSFSRSVFLISFRKLKELLKEAICVKQKGVHKESVKVKSLPS